MRWLILLPWLVAWGEPARIITMSDQAAFGQWFTFLAESQYYLPGAKRPAEIKDCAALVRFAYREALRVHDGAWAARTALPKLPALRPFPRQAVDPRFQVGGGQVAHFADAKTLRQWNSRLVSRELREARPGDLLFFHQDGGRLPFHVMVYVGRSHFEKEEVVVYHTGPVSGDAGEIRRLTLKELWEHPEPRWRPAVTNSHFLGVYRWNLLGGAAQ
jgi:uncharacterized protein